MIRCVSFRLRLEISRARWVCPFRLAPSYAHLVRTGDAICQNRANRFPHIGRETKYQKISLANPPPGLYDCYRPLWRLAHDLICRSVDVPRRVPIFSSRAHLPDSAPNSRWATVDRNRYLSHSLIQTVSTEAVRYCVDMGWVTSIEATHNNSPSCGEYIINGITAAGREFLKFS